VVGSRVLLAISESWPVAVNGSDLPGNRLVVRQFERVESRKFANPIENFPLPFAARTSFQRQLEGGNIKRLLIS
jgi:hypothetical protein